MEAAVSSPRADGDAARLDAAGVSIAYGSRTILDAVSLAFAPGRIHAIIGPSGCGKTSFLCSLNRLTDLVPGCHVSGRIQLGSVDVHSAQADVIALRRRMGMIFQQPNPFPLSIRRNLDLPLREHGVRNRAERDERLITALRDVGLWDEVKDRLDKSALELSGGQQQRLCIARALVLRPDVLLLDEPCTALDPLSTRTIEDLLVSLRDRLTQVVVTHNLGQARRIADEVAFFWTSDGRGRLVEHGPAADVFSNPRDPLTAAYIAGRAG
jgi:phosphate transport system ATP-binding protein